MKKHFSQVRGFVSKNISVPVMIALLSVGSIAVAKNSSHKFADVRWRNNGSAWVQVTGEYTCSGSTNICTRLYPDGQNPNTAPNGYISQQNGVFAQ